MRAVHARSLFLLNNNHNPTTTVGIDEDEQDRVSLQRSMNIHNVITNARMNNNYNNANSHTTSSSSSSSSSSSFIRRRLLLLDSSELISTADDTTSNNNNNANECIQFYHVSIMPNEINTCTNSGVYVSLLLTSISQYAYNV